MQVSQNVSSDEKDCPKADCLREKPCQCHVVTYFRTCNVILKRKEGYNRRSGKRIGYGYAGDKAFPLQIVVNHLAAACSGIGLAYVRRQG